MAQWSQADRTLYAKLVYYGPAFGGKTTNLEALHRITDPGSRHELVSIQTVNDRTIFFDLLPFELGDMFGYRVALKLYTVPGQVRYEKTRQVVLAGADAIVFVADSSPEREEQNRWSLQNLTMNMRAKGLDADDVPVLFQANKQDLDGAADPALVASWLRLPETTVIPAVATTGQGVLETFAAAGRSMLERLVRLADEPTRSEIDTARLEAYLEQAFARFAPDSADNTPSDETDETEARESGTTIVLEDDDVLQNSVRTSMCLSERLIEETARAQRLEREAAACRALASLTGRSESEVNDDGPITDAALRAASEVLGARAVSLVQRSAAGRLELVRAWGRLSDPLLGFDQGRRLLARVLEAAQPVVVPSLATECPGADAQRYLQGIQALAGVPLGADAALVAYAPEPDGSFTDADLRFLESLGHQLAAGMAGGEAPSAGSASRDPLVVRLADEMQRDVDSLLIAGRSAVDPKRKSAARQAAAQNMVEIAEALQERLRRLTGPIGTTQTDPPAPNGTAGTDGTDVTAASLVAEAIRISGRTGIKVRESDAEIRLRGDVQHLARTLAELIDSAAQQSARADRIEVELCAEPIDIEGVSVGGLSIRILESRTEGKRGKRRTRPALGRLRTAFQRHGAALDHTERDGGRNEFRVHVPLHPQTNTSTLEPASV